MSQNGCSTGTSQNVYSNVKSELNFAETLHLLKCTTQSCDFLLLVYTAETTLSDMQQRCMNVTVKENAY